MTPNTLTGRRLGATALVTALVLAACGGGGDDDEEATATTVASTTTVADTTTTTSTTTSTTTTTSLVPPPTSTAAEPDVTRQPLTGVPVADDSELITRPALAVKIDNANPARQNHTGLARADIVFEEIVEDQNTRFAAVFHTDDAEPIGPIRSGRSQDVDLLSSFNLPLFAWSGGNAGVTRLIQDAFLVDLNATNTPNTYFRGDGRAPSNLYSTSEALWALTPPDHPGAPSQQYAYLAPGAEFVGVPATRIDLEMLRRDLAWDWDAGAGAYVRSMDGEPHVDVTYGPMAFENVIVMAVDYQPSPVDARSPEAQTVGNGPAFIFSNGQLQEGRWFREDAIFPLQFIDANSNPIRLTPGRTWIHLAEGQPTDDIANPSVDLTWS